jgi:hypothetical protein
MVLDGTVRIRTVCAVALNLDGVADGIEDVLPIVR